MTKLGDIRPDGSILLLDDDIKFRDAMSGTFRRVRQTSVQKLALAKSGYQHVNSSFISAVRQDGEDLYIRFHNASVYVYYGQGNKFDRMLKANSKGQYFNRSIRRTLAYKKVDDIPLKSGELDIGVAGLTDKELFNAMDFDYINKVVKGLTGGEVLYGEKILDGVLMQHIKIKDIDIYRPIVSQ